MLQIQGMVSQPTIDIGSGNSLLWEVVLCIIGCLVLSLASTH